MRTTTRPIRVMLADDHSLVREGLRSLLASEPDLELVAEATNGLEAVEMALRTKPDVLLLDIRMPGESGLEALRRIKAGSPDTEVLLLTMHDVRTYVREALGSGAAGYLLKDSPPALIRQAVRTAAQHGTVLHERARELLLSDAAKGSGGEDRLSEAQAPPLSERELEILTLVANGNSNRQVADRLHLAESTVKKYVQSLMGKLRAADRTEAAVIGMRLGLVR